MYLVIENRGGKWNHLDGGRLKVSCTQSTLIPIAIAEQSNRGIVFLSTPLEGASPTPGPIPLPPFYWVLRDRPDRFRVSYVHVVVPFIAKGHHAMAHISLYATAFRRHHRTEELDINGLLARREAAKCHNNYC